MSARLVRTTLAAAALAASFGLAGCTAGDDGTAAAPATQAVRNDAAHDLAAAQRATLVPVAVQLEVLDREQQRAELAGATATTDVEQRIAAYRELADSIEAAPSAETVRTLVDRAGLQLGVALDDSAVPASPVPTAPVD